jgi:hypothetical protein
MNTYKVTLLIRAECEADAEELLQGYTGAETDLTLIEIKKLEE